MQVSTIAEVTTVLPALATLSQGIDRTARKGKRVRLYRAESALLQTEEITKAITTLVESGYEVRIYEGDRIYKPTVVAGTVVWEYRTTKKVRDRVVVEVKL